MDGNKDVSYFSPQQKTQSFSFSSKSALWQSTVDIPLRNRAIEVALEIAERMRDPTHVLEIFKLACRQTQPPHDFHLISFSRLAFRLALMYEYIARCYPNQQWERVVQQYIRIAAAGTQQETISTYSLFGGSSEIAFVLHKLCESDTRYQQAFSRVNERLCEQVAAKLWHHPDNEWGVTDFDYDVISGAAGVLAYLCQLNQPDKKVQEAIVMLVRYLTWLAEPEQPLGKERWYIPSKYMSTEAQRARSPEGHFNCGLAHGIPGPLAALALTWLAGYRYPGSRECIFYLSDWVIKHSVSDQWGIGWPASVPLPLAYSSEDWQRLDRAQDAWCYGTAGVARSLWLAGQALEDASLCKQALEGFLAILHRPIQQRYIPSPTICHGVAGLLQICLRFAHETDYVPLQNHISSLTSEILALFNPSSPLGFCDLEYNGTLVDQPAWLTGAPGIVMVLLATSTCITPSWDRTLLIS